MKCVDLYIGGGEVVSVCGRVCVGWGEVCFTQLCPTLCDPVDCSLPGSNVWDSPGNTGSPGFLCIDS